MWVFKVLFGYDRTPNKSVEPHFGSTNTDCTGQTDRRFLREKPEFLSAKGTTKKADAFVFFVYPNFNWDRQKVQKQQLFLFFPLHWQSGGFQEKSVCLSVCPVQLVFVEPKCGWTLLLGVRS